MPKMTDYVREGFKRRRRPWDRAELPEWWDLVGWVGLAGVVAALVFGAIFSTGGSGGDGTEDAGAPRYSAQTLNPYTPSPAPSASGSTATTPAETSPAPGAGPPQGVETKDFTATAAAQVPLIRGGTAVVPAGARNVAVAAARAQATGDWAGIPFVGPKRLPAASMKANPQGSVIGEVTVTDPSVTGNTQYLFSATITRGGGAKPYVVQIAVERDRSGYAIRVL